ncbi:MAG: YgjV family protein [Bacilli bacterium]|nr:YgjV family protein [Bacilli bacterium]
MTWQFVLSQITALIAWIFFMLSYHAKRENKIILLQIISGLFYSISYLLAGATTGLLISLFETIVEFFYYKSDKDKYIYIFTIPIYIAIGFLSGESGFLVIIPIAASLIDGYGLIRNNKIMVACGIISNLMWIIYDVYYLEYITALGDLFLVISNLSIVFHGIIKYINRKKVKIYNINELSDKDLEDVKKLDDECYDSIYRWPLSKLTELYLREKDSYLLIKYKDELVGYINFLNVTEDIYNKAMETSELIDSFEEKDILPYHKRERLFINLNSIVLRREYNNIKIKTKIINSIKKYINKKRRNKYNIKHVFIYTVNEFEESIVKELGFNQVKKITEECILYSKDY